MSELNQDVLRALRTLDDDWDMEAARARVRARVARHTADAAGTPAVAAPMVARRSRGAVWGLSRAAGILLVTAAAAYALPGSPVRRWVRSSMTHTPTTVETPVETVTPPAAANASEASGVRLSVPSGALRVVLRDVAPGTEIRVTLVPGTEAAVYAAAGSRFTSAAGRVEARVAPGDVRVELPRGVDPVSLEVGGRIYLRGTDAGLDVSGPVVTRDGAEIVFRVPLT